MSTSDDSTGGSSTDAGTANAAPSDGGSSTAGATDAGSSSNGSSDAGASTANASDAGSSTNGSSDAGASTSGSTDAGSSTSNSTDAGSTDAGTPADASTTTPAAPIDYKALVAIPSGINDGLTSADPTTMTNALGNPGTPDPGCGPSSPALAKLMKTDSVGPFRVTGLGPAVDALTRVFAAVQSAQPELYKLLGTEGMLCVRYVRGSTTNFSNHSWGTAIDITIGGILTARGATTVTQGLLSLCPFMHAEQFFWGAGFSPTPDGMHFEVSSELLAAWKANGTIP